MLELDNTLRGAEIMKKAKYSISIWISILDRYRRSFILKELEPYGALGGMYLVVLTIYNHNGTSQERLSDLLKTDKAAIARAVKKLENEKYITRETDTADKRFNKVYLTPKAQALVPEIQKAIDKWDRLVISSIPEDAYHIIEQYMEEMAKNACKIFTCAGSGTEMD